MEQSQDQGNDDNAALAANIVVNGGSVVEESDDAVGDFNFEGAAVYGDEESETRPRDSRDHCQKGRKSITRVLLANEEAMQLQLLPNNHEKHDVTSDKSKQGTSVADGTGESSSAVAVEVAH